MAIGLTTNKVQTDGSTVSAGTNITGFSAPVGYDRGITQTPSPRVIKAQFGDGYQMRMIDGINNTPRVFALNFNNRTNDDIDKLYKFFETLASVNTCRLTIPNSVDGEENITVVISEFNKVYNYDEFYSMSCKAEEVFET